MEISTNALFIFRPSQFWELKNYCTFFSKHDIYIVLTYYRIFQNSPYGQDILKISFNLFKDQIKSDLNSTGFYVGKQSSLKKAAESRWISRISWLFVSDIMLSNSNYFSKSIIYCEFIAFYYIPYHFKADILLFLLFNFYFFYFILLSFSSTIYGLYTEFFLINFKILPKCALINA